MGLGIPPLRIKIMIESKPSEIHDVSTEIGRGSISKMRFDVVLSSYDPQTKTRRGRATIKALEANQNRAFKLTLYMHIHIYTYTS